MAEAELPWTALLRVQRPQSRSIRHAGKKESHLILL
jgi:hypothetical protein